MVGDTKKPTALRPEHTHQPKRRFLSGNVFLPPSSPLGGGLVGEGQDGGPFGEDPPTLLLPHKSPTVGDKFPTEMTWGEEIPCVLNIIVQKFTGADLRLMRMASGGILHGVYPERSRRGQNDKCSLSRNQGPALRFDSPDKFVTLRAWEINPISWFS